MANNKPGIDPKVIKRATQRITDKVKSDLAEYLHHANSNLEFIKDTAGELPNCQLAKELATIFDKIDESLQELQNLL